MKPDATPTPTQPPSAGEPKPGEQKPGEQKQERGIKLDAQAAEHRAFLQQHLVGRYEPQPQKAAHPFDIRQTPDAAEAVSPASSYDADGAGNGQ